MPVDSASLFATVIQEHLELRRRNAALEHEMPLDRYMPDDPFENHPLFKTEEQARIEDTLDGNLSIVDEPTSLEWPTADTFPEAPIAAAPAPIPAPAPVSVPATDPESVEEQRFEEPSFEKQSFEEQSLEKQGLETQSLDKHSVEEDEQSFDETRILPNGLDASSAEEQAVEEPGEPEPTVEEPAPEPTDEGLWSRSRDFDWGD